MKIFKSSIQFRDFVPPIVVRVLRKVLRIGRSEGARGRLHPFDCVQDSVRAKLIFDIGANHGLVAESALQSYPDCTVVCFEPVSETLKSLKSKLAPYGNRAIYVDKALSDENGEGEINLTTFDGANSILPQSILHQELNPKVREVGKEKISLARLDDIVDSLPPGTIDIMKVDVEGYEMQVLRGAEKTLRERVDSVIIEFALQRDEAWEQQSYVDLFVLMRELDFILVNVFDLYPTADRGLAQMDCVFRKASKIRAAMAVA